MVCLLYQSKVGPQCRGMDFGSYEREAVKRPRSLALEPTPRGGTRPPTPCRIEYVSEAACSAVNERRDSRRRQRTGRRVRKHVHGALSGRVRSSNQGAGSREFSGHQAIVVDDDGTNRLILLRCLEAWALNLAPDARTWHQHSRMSGVPLTPERRSPLRFLTTVCPSGGALRAF